MAIVILGHVFQNPQKAAQQLHLLAAHLAQFSLAAFLLLRLLLPVRLQPRNYLVFFRCRNLSFLLRAGGIIVWLRIELATRNSQLYDSQFTCSRFKIKVRFSDALLVSHIENNTKTKNAKHL